MKKIIISIAITVCAAQLANAQSIQRNVIASAGNSSTSGTVVLSSTIGETFTSTLSSANKKITQGFQQGNIIVARIQNSDLPENNTSEITSELSLSIFPNPTTDFVNISSETDEQINLTVLDASGKLIQQLQHSAQQTQIDFTNFNAGIYFIVAQSANGNSRNTYKVIKQQ